MSKPGYNAPYQPGNPSNGNVPTIQGITNYVNANDFRGQTYAYERITQNPHGYPKVVLKNNQYTPLDAFNNRMQPRKYPDPSCQTTKYPSRKTRKPPMNGSVCAYNPVKPLNLPASGTNDVGFIVTVGL